MQSHEQSSTSGEAARPAAPFGRILIGFDDSEVSHWAVQVGGELAGRLGAQVRLFHVIDLSKGFSPELEILDERILGQLRTGAAELLDRRQRELPSVLRVTREISEGTLATAIVAAAERWQADLIVIGTHARGTVARFLLGSTAEAVVRGADCPVITVGHPPGFLKSAE